MQTLAGPKKPGVWFWQTALLLIVALGLVGALAAFSGMTMKTFAAVLVSVPVWAWPTIAVAQAVMVVLGAWKWQMLMRDLSKGQDRISLGSATAATTLGTLAGQIMPIQLVTPAARAMVARQKGISPVRALGSSAFEQMFDLLALAAFVATIALLWLVDMQPTAGLVLGAVVAVLATLFVRPTLHLFGRAASTLPLTRRLGTGMQQAARLPLASLMRPMVLSVIRLALVAAINVGILKLLVPGADVVALLLAVPVAQLASALPLLPAGLGLVEAGWTGILMLQGVSAPDAAAVAISLRIVSTVPFLAVSPLLLMLGMQRTVA